MKFLFIQTLWKTRQVRGATQALCLEVIFLNLIYTIIIFFIIRFNFFVSNITLIFPININLTHIKQNTYFFLVCKLVDNPVMMRLQ